MIHKTTSFSIGYKNIYSVFLCLLLTFLMSSCSKVPGSQVAEGVAPLVAPSELGDNQLLNVSIKVFDPGSLPQDPEDRQGLSMEIREAEGRFVPIHLKHTLQQSGYWGAVRVVPDDDIAAEVLVRGKIEYSDGESAVLAVEVIDSRNVVWFKRTYAETSRPEEHEGTIAEKNDTFQDLFNSIANDITKYRLTLTPREVEIIRDLTELKYASSMAPDTFKDYLEERDGYNYIRYLPAEDDVMMERVRKIRVRDEMLVDAINDYYDIYYRDLWEPYSNWRKFRQEEVAAMRKIEREATTRQLLGVAAIVGAIALGVSDVDFNSGAMQGAMVMGGAYALHSGQQKREEAQINKDTIMELGDSFTATAEPLTMEVDGETVRLTGSAEEQYTKWRGLLRQLYARETGFIPESVIAQPQTAPSSSQ